MSPLLAALICIASYVVAYRVYARFLAERVFVIDPARPTPAVRFRDEIDYVPANRYVLFGHQYASITGLSPMLGPAIAVIWGWLPAMAWVVLGAIFVGAVHDFGALVVSIRARGMSLGKVTENLVGPRGKTLFHLVIFFLIALAMGVFVHVIAVLFSPDFYPQAVLPSGALVFVAAAMGVAVHRGGWSIRSLTVAGLAVALGLAFLGIRQPVVGPSLAQWKWLLLAYAFGASVLPVWLLLQPRDYINSLLLYVGVGAMYIGFVATNPSFVAPAVDLAPEGAPPIVPFVFVVIACGAASGFHALMSSGSTAKQLATEGDARFVGYGAMIGGVLGGFIYVTIFKPNFPKWVALDVAAPGMILGQAVGRFGDFVNGEHFANASELPWAFRYTHPLTDGPWSAPGVDDWYRGSRGFEGEAPVTVHPVAGGYEPILDLMILGGLFLLRRMGVGAGWGFTFYVFAYAVVRGALSLLRTDEAAVAGALSVPQLLAILTAVAAVWMALHLRRHRQPPVQTGLGVERHTHRGSRRGGLGRG